MLTQNKDQILWWWDKGVLRDTWACDSDEVGGISGRAFRRGARETGAGGEESEIGGEQRRQKKEPNQTPVD